MNIKSTSILAGLALVLTCNAFAQKPGDAVTPDALGKAEWVQGVAPSHWEPGKVYILECWATWCGPCIAAIPHIDALYDKYQEKGLRVLGMNVWEEGKEKVVSFVKKKGDGMSYPVAYVGKEGAFEKEWLVPAEVKGIPHAFIVKDGKVLMTAHPAEITENLIETLLAGGEAQTNLLEKFKQEEARKSASAEIISVYWQASSRSDVPTMEKALADLKAADAAHPSISIVEADIAFNKREWTAVEQAIVKSPDEERTAMMLGVFAQKVAHMTDVPESFRKKLDELLAASLKKQGDLWAFLALSELRWSSGEKDAAKASVKEALEWAKSPSEDGMPSYFVSLFEKVAASLEQGEYPSQKEIHRWLKEAMPKP